MRTIILILLLSASNITTCEGAEPYWVEPKNNPYIEVLNWTAMSDDKKEQEPCPYCMGTGYTANCEECLCPACLGTGKVDSEK